jgi:hypothetical protein
LYEVAVEEANGDGEPVDLGFDGEGGLLSCEAFAYAGKKIDQFTFAVGIVETLHADGVGDGTKGVEGGAADFPGGGIFVDELWMGFFEFGKLAVESIVGGVGDLGLGLDVVKEVVVPNLFEEVGIVLSGGAAHLGRRRRVSPIAIPRTSANQSLTETSRPGARRWDCSSRPPRRDPAMPIAAEGKGSPPRTKPKPV